MNNENEKEIEGFLNEIKSVFPEVSLLITASLEKHGFTPEDKMYTSEMEAFSQATTDAIKDRDKERVSSYLMYMSRKLVGASPKVHEYINVYYVECLMLGIKDSNLKTFGWKLMPKNLKDLYLEVWGRP